MKILIIIAALFFCEISAYCQVHVRGYYRSDGTYVAPHERTRPNSTVTDNYSYPGNYNPNKANNVDLSQYTPPAYYLESEGAKVSTSDKKNIFVKNKVARLRASPSANGEIICTMNYREHLLLIENNGNGWSKVLYEYYKGYGLSLPRYVTGFVSSNLLSLDYPSKNESFYVNGLRFEVTPDMAASASIDSNGNLDGVSAYLKRLYGDKGNSGNTSNFTNNLDCLYNTNFDNLSSSPPLRSAPNIESAEIYSCPLNAYVCVLEKSNAIFYKVTINGKTGYISKSLLKKQ